MSHIHISYIVHVTRPHTSASSSIRKQVHTRYNTGRQSCRSLPLLVEMGDWALPGIIYMCCLSYAQTDTYFSHITYAWRQAPHSTYLWLLFLDIWVADAEPGFYCPVKGRFIHNQSSWHYVPSWVWTYQSYKPEDNPREFVEWNQFPLHIGTSICTPSRIIIIIWNLPKFLSWHINKHR